MPDRTGSGKSQEILIEFLVQGNTAKVTAIEPSSGTEVSIVAPATAPRAILEANVARKLAYVMKKQRGAD